MNAPRVLPPHSAGRQDVVVVVTEDGEPAADECSANLTMQTRRCRWEGAVPRTVEITQVAQNNTRRARVLTIAWACLVLAGCANQATTSPPPTQSVTPPVATSSPGFSAELCSAAAEYQKAANAIVNLDATKVGTEGVKAALQDLQTAASNLATAARAQFGAQVAELDKAVASLKETLAGLSSQDSLSTNLGKIAASVAGVEQAAGSVVDNVRAGCPTVPPVVAPPSS